MYSYFRHRVSERFTSFGSKGGGDYLLFSGLLKRLYTILPEEFEGGLSFSFYLGATLAAGCTFGRCRNFDESTFDYYWINRNQIVITIYRLIWNQTKFRLVLNQSRIGKIQSNSGLFNEIEKRFLCVSRSSKDGVFPPGEFPEGI